MTSLTGTTTLTDGLATPDAPLSHSAALAAAEQLLTSTVDAINPTTPAPELRAFLTRYRTHLSALVAVSRPAITPGIPARPS